MPEDNVSVNPELNDEDFFDALDKALQGSIIDVPSPTVNPDDGVDDVVEEPANPEQDPEELKAELEKLKKRYEDSSREARRLYEELQKLKEYEDYIPLLQVMKNDENLVEHVRNYLESSGTPAAVTQKLDLPEDFIFDFDEAVKDPESDSAKVLATMVDSIVSQRLQVVTQQQQAESRLKDELERFKERMKLKDEELTELIDWSKTHQLSLEDIYYLKNREKREQEIAKQAVKEVEQQLKKMRGIPKSLTSLGTPPKNDKDDVNRAVFDMIKKTLGY